MGTKRDARSRDPLDAVPSVAPNVEARPDKDGQIEIRRELPARGKLWNKMERLLGFNRYVMYRLDPVGTTFWEQIDGARDLHYIETQLRGTYGFDTTKSRQAVIEYTKSMMVRGLICLKVAGLNRE